MNAEFREGFDFAVNVIYAIIDKYKDRALFSQHQMLLKIEDELENEVYLILKDS